MAVKTIRNSDPEPDDPHDYHILTAVMKCADGELYHLVFSEEWLVPDTLEKINLKRPSQEAFGEGDVVTVQQMSSAASQKEIFGEKVPDVRSFAGAYMPK